MLSVPVQKDIGEYTEKIVKGLSFRTLLGLVLGIGLAVIVAVVGINLFHLEIDRLALPIMAVVMVCFIAGYVKPLGMPFEKAFPLLLHQFFGKTDIYYCSSLALAYTAICKKEFEEERKVKKDAWTKSRQERYASARKKRGTKSPEIVLARIYAETPESEATTQRN